MTTSDTVRVPPHSVDAEQGLLGGLLMDNGAFDAIDAALRPSDFYRYEHQRIWDAIAALVHAGRPADVLTVHERLQRCGVADECGGLEYLNAMAQSVPNAANAREYARIVADRSTRRAVIALAGELSAKAVALGPADDPQQLLDHAVTALLALQDGRRDDEPQDLSALAVRFMDELQERADGHTGAFGTGLRDLDRLTSEGGRRGELWVIGARPSMGKTAFSLSLCRAVGCSHQVLMLTMEDSLGMLTARHVAAAGRVNLAHIRNPMTAPGQMWQGVADGVQALTPLRIAMGDKGCMSLSDVRRQIQRTRRRHGDCALVVIDYLQLMEGEGDNRNQALGALANGLKRTAKELDCWIVLLSQLSREADKSKSPPEMHHLRDSGDIEGAADMIGLLYRRFRWTKKDDDKHLAELHVVKQKNGPTDTLRFFFDGATQRFGNWQDDMAED